LAAQEPYAEQLVHLLSAVIYSPQTGQPVILCLPRWDHAAHLIEALLMLLPPEVRCRLTFTTYEHDPYRLQGLGSATSQSAQLPLQIVATLSRAEGGAFKFEHDEYQTQFAIFNFAEQQFSPPSAPSAYAQYVADCCRHCRIDRVASVQKLLTAMEVGRQPDQWDKVLPAVFMQDPFDPQPGPEAIDTPVSRHRRQKRHTDAAHTSGSQYPSGARRQSFTIAAAPHGTGDRRVAPARGGIGMRRTGAPPMGVASPGCRAWGCGVGVFAPLGWAGLLA